MIIFIYFILGIIALIISRIEVKDNLYLVKIGNNKIEKASKVWIPEDSKKMIYLLKKTNECKEVIPKSECCVDFESCFLGFKLGTFGSKFASKEDIPKTRIMDVTESIQNFLFLVGMFCFFAFGIGICHSIFTIESVTVRSIFFWSFEILNVFFIASNLLKWKLNIDSNDPDKSSWRYIAKLFFHLVLIFISFFILISIPYQL